MGRPKGVKLTPNQLRFCSEYAADRNATRAYIRAFPGTPYNTARSNCIRLLAKASVKAEIDAAEKEHARRTAISARRVLRELAGVAFNDVSDAFTEDNANGGLPTPRPLSQISPATRRTIQSVKVKRRKSVNGEVTVIEEVEYKFADKLSALDKLCKHLGLTKDGAALEELIHALRQDAATGPQAVPQASLESGNPPDPGRVESRVDSPGTEPRGEVPG